MLTPSSRAKDANRVVDRLICRRLLTSSEYQHQECEWPAKETGCPILVTRQGWESMTSLLPNHPARNRIQHPVQEVDRLRRRVSPPNLQSLVDHNWKRSALESQHLAHCHAQQVTIHGRHALQPPMFGIGHDQLVNLSLVCHGHAEQILGKTPHLGFHLVAGLPECGPNLVRRLLPNVRLK